MEDPEPPDGARAMARLRLEVVDLLAPERELRVRGVNIEELAGERRDALTVRARGPGSAVRVVGEDDVLPCRKRDLLPGLLLAPEPNVGDAPLPGRVNRELELTPLEVSDELIDAGRLIEERQRDSDDGWNGSERKEAQQLFVEPESCLHKRSSGPLLFDPIRN